MPRPEPPHRPPSVDQDLARALESVVVGWGGDDQDGLRAALRELVVLARITQAEQDRHRTVEALRALAEALPRVTAGRLMAALDQLE